MTSRQNARWPILHMVSRLINKFSKHFFPGKGLIKRRGRVWRVTFETLPDEVLIDIFDFYRMSFSQYPWKWHMLVHVCRRWRQIIFASPCRLDLQFLCTPSSPVRELLDFLPPIPIMISNWSGAPPPYLTLCLEDGSQVISAIEQRDRVWWIHLDGLASSLLEKLATMMHETFPTLAYVRLWSNDETVPVLPETFLGGSSPCLQTFWLHGIPFPELPKLLLSTNDLVDLRLEKIPDSGYISPEAMITGLSTSTKLETLIIDFRSADPHPPDLTSQQPVSHLTRIVSLSSPTLGSREMVGISTTSWPKSKAPYWSSTTVGIIVTPRTDTCSMKHFSRRGESGIRFISESSLSLSIF
ncbi:hypothetical protein BJV74DRAFT_421897 [Russula compacta]|nr:hypothetical protein BJV74DRAFT_421897 [Russula compacta]